ncbi:MAG: hypothetical protein GY718_01865 [Lentisphaerae bacterium]|nr:hypothetical protein [Lentisphaerota bacterium]
MDKDDIAEQIIEQTLRNCLVVYLKHHSEEGKSIGSIRELLFEMISEASDYRLNMSL